MHIAQLEEALELSRASIRFYEKEGLLSPERLANGYRDYSEEDLETLRRVKLLRALGLPLEDIKALQAGTLDLPAALRAQEERLRREQRQREAALSLCQTLEGEGVAYRDLEAGPYLEELSRLEREGVQLQPPAADSLPCAPYPWRRFLARQLDRSLLSLLFSAVLSLVLRRRLGEGLPWDLFETYLLWGIQFLVEPLLLSTWGTTPGKWIFGLQVRSSDGRKLTFGEAQSRLWGLFRYGEGYGIPFYKAAPHNC
ncbi:MerR family transcriptional regulator [uncultured Intestinimonas sp.]|uniref:MerR family transcriptional regulator n=1 Tax=uncultured Intestinimonas sp. TaxID=1689265 RepID=UPI0025EDF8D5|nr:MerR family transcriptional regulator [uncultured Intestinimonas sp.]